MSRRQISLCFLVLPVWLSLSGCTTYLEEETPVGTVSPASVAPVPSPAPAARGADDQPPAANGESAAEQEEGVLAAFAKSYASKKHPRIAVFLNRELSDDVREWRSSARATVAEETSKRKTSPETRATEKRTAVAASIERPADTGSRPKAAGERWMWAFEEAFLDPFLRAKARVVDRSTIVRLAANKADHGTAISPIAVKRVEVAALKDHADLFIEILVHQSDAAPYGYEFKASAKEVSTGTILANVTSLRWEKRRLGRVVSATSEGYEVGEGYTVPAIQQAAKRISLDLISAMNHAWGQ